MTPEGPRYSSSPGPSCRASVSMLVAAMSHGLPAVQQTGGSLCPEASTSLVEGQGPCPRPWEATTSAGVGVLTDLLRRKMQVGGWIS